MAPPTIRWAVAETLEDLSKKDFSRFCFVLPDRGIKSSAVEDKNPLEITTLLVETFTEHGALKVVVEILRQIKSNQVADMLESKTKDCVDKGDPTFRKNSQGELDTNPSREAQAGKRPVAAAGGPPKTPEEVVTEAKNRVRAEGGNLSNDRLILSRYTIQFGQYRDKTFKWLLENDARYAAWVVATHQLEPQQNNRQDPRMSNKDSLADYALFYPEVMKEVEHEKAKLRSQLPQQSGNYGPQKWKSKYKAETRFSPMKKKPRGSWRRT